MNFKLLKYNTIPVFRVTQIPRPSPSYKLLFITNISIGLQPNYFEEKEKTYYFFYNQAGNYIKSLTIKNKVKQLLNCKSKSNINDSIKCAVNWY